MPLCGFGFVVSRIPGDVRRTMRQVAALALLPCLAGCFSVTVDPRALTAQANGRVLAQSQSCNDHDSARAAEAGTAPDSLDPRAIRVATWNIHKEADSGWERDLARLARDHDILLLQEIILADPVRRIIDGERLRWVMASSFYFGDDDVGVLTAARVAPAAFCTARVVEPLLRLPKSAIIAWFRLRDTKTTLAVVNVHAINFSLSLETYQAQFEALGQALAGHDGPIVFAGDFNTWTDGRSEVVRTVATKLGLVEITFASDRRSLFFGRQLDHIWVRGLEVVDSTAIPVTSSDHNPVAATLRTTVP
jgi:endonuclease/exonuclease/phosphatase (EEP) superfamily protein YafD